MLILTMLSFSPYSAASSARIGAITRQVGHHGAQKSTATGTVSRWRVARIEGTPALSQAESKVRAATLAVVGIRLTFVPRSEDGTPAGGACW